MYGLSKSGLHGCGWLVGSFLDEDGMCAPPGVNHVGQVFFYIDNGLVKPMYPFTGCIREVYSGSQ